MSTLKIYKSSAGSGKTFTLVLEYLKLVLLHPEDYKSILAITFTNKSAEEMKNRIIEALTSLSSGIENSIHKILTEELPDTDITKQSAKALKYILHDYSSFSVSTIDSFFQRILRALAREIHLPMNLQVQVELDDAILDVTDRLLKEIGIDTELTKWMTDLVLQKMDDEKGWNLENDIRSVAKELFKEEHHNAKILTREEIQLHHKKLLITKNNFENKMKEFGENVLQIIRSNGLDIPDFAYGNGGVAGYFGKISSPANGENYKPSMRVTNALNDSEKWATKKSNVRNEIIELAENKLIPLLQKIIMYVESEYKNYMTANEIIRKIYLFGLVNDLQKKFTEYRNENNVILLSDTTRLLSHIIGENDAPFLYEKTGNRYKHLLIDEFQDTSILQWNNLLPLIINALGSGFMTLIVGDVKQSIYRWRGGNMNLLMRDVYSNLKQFKSMMKEEVLSTNFRSKKTIVEFNNDFFTHAPQLANKEIDMKDFPSLITAYNSDLLQKTSDKNNSGGYVKINFIKNDDVQEEDEEKSGWKKSAFNEMLSSINDLLKKGYEYRNICILVRKNNDGNEIANLLFQNGIEEVISPDSLLITASPKINFLINIFRFLSDNKNSIARSEIIYYYRSYLTQGIEENWHDLFSDHRKSGLKKKNHPSKIQTLFEGLEENTFNSILPDAFTSQISSLGKLPVYELCEQISAIFNLNNSQDAYTQRFLDLVLEYSINSNSSLEGFLQWWDTASNVSKCSVIIPENTNAIRIMTIHSAKGLQFPVVMMPFTEWSLLPKSNELKWMNLKGTPFEELGTVAITTSARLKETYFSEEYENEINQTVIDNLNLLYVAFTRAEEKLFITCPAGNENILNSVSKLIYKTCKNIFPEFDGFVFEKGDNSHRGNVPDKKNTKIITQQLASYKVSGWQEKMSLKTHSGDLLEMFDAKHLTKINYGIIIHSILAGIQKTTEIDSVIDKIVFEGLITREEKKQLKIEIASVLSIPEIASFFDEGYTVLAEREILLPNGEVLRPDRVIIKDDHAIVIDFKTGRRETKHETQVRNYSEILKTMNYKSVEGKIVYLSERQIASVL